MENCELGTHHDKLCAMAIQVVEFSIGVYKIRKIFAKKSIYPKEIFAF